MKTSSPDTGKAPQGSRTPASFISVEEGGHCLRSGGLVGFPTETVYGLGCDVFNRTAVDNLYATKGRPRHNPLIVHVSNTSQVEWLTRDIPPVARVLMSKFWPGPLTIVLPRSKYVPSNVTAGGPTVGIRMPANEMALELISEAGSPVAAPSANRFGYISPTTADHVVRQFGSEICGVIDGGPCGIGVESTVVKIEEGRVRILRPGAIDLRALEIAVGSLPTTSRPMTSEILESPGQLKSHYSPRTTFELYPEIPDHLLSREDLGFILPSPPNRTIAGKVEILSETGELDEIARNLYAAMRRLDESGLTGIVAQKAPDFGIGIAINDRLEKAAHQ